MQVVKHIFISTCMNFCFKVGAAQIRHGGHGGAQISIIFSLEIQIDIPRRLHPLLARCMSPLGRSFVVSLFGLRKMHPE